MCQDSSKSSKCDEPYSTAKKEICMKYRCNRGFHPNRNTAFINTEGGEAYLRIIKLLLTSGPQECQRNTQVNLFFLSPIMHKHDLHMTV